MKYFFIFLNCNMACMVHKLLLNVIGGHVHLSANHVFSLFNIVNVLNCLGSKSYLKFLDKPNFVFMLDHFYWLLVTFKRA